MLSIKQFLAKGYNKSHFLKFESSIERPFLIFEMGIYIVFLLWLFLAYIPSISFDINTISYFDIDTALHVDSSLKTSLITATGWRGYGLGWYKSVWFLDLFINNPLGFFYSDSFERITSNRLYVFMTLNCFSLLGMFYLFFSASIEERGSKLFQFAFSLRLAVLMFLALASKGLWVRFIFRAYPDVFMISLLGIIFILTITATTSKRYLLIGFLSGFVVSVKLPSLLLLAPLFLFFIKKEKRVILYYLSAALIAYFIFSYPIDWSQFPNIISIVFHRSDKLISYSAEFSSIWATRFFRNLVDLYFTFSVVTIFLFLMFKKSGIVNFSIFWRVFVINLFVLGYLLFYPLKIETRHYPMIILPMILYCALFFSKIISRFLSGLFLFRNDLRQWGPILKGVLCLTLSVLFFFSSEIIGCDRVNYFNKVKYSQLERRIIGDVLENIDSKKKIARIFRTSYTERYQYPSNLWFASTSQKVLNDSYDVAVISRLFTRRFKLGALAETDKMTRLFNEINENHVEIFYENLQLKLIYKGKYAPINIYYIDKASNKSKTDINSGESVLE